MINQCLLEKHVTWPTVAKYLLEILLQWLLSVVLVQCSYSGYNCKAKNKGEKEKETPKNCPAKC